MSKHIDVAKRMAHELGFDFISFIAAGAFKETYKVFGKNRGYLALKITNKKGERTSRELKALGAISCKFIASQYEFGDKCFEGVNYFYSVEEFLEGGTLANQIEGGRIVSPHEVCRYGVQLAKAIATLKSFNFVHRDIKPDNIMFREKHEVVLVDLGLVRDLSANSLTATWLMRGPGTPLYSSPEQLNNDKYLITWQSDQFSLGLVLGQCLTGKHPYSIASRTESQMVEAMASRTPVPEEFSNTVRQLGLPGVLKMLAPWPIERHHKVSDLYDVFKEAKGHV